MHELTPYLRLLATERPRLVGGALLMLATALSSVGLLGLAGWYITATGVTGLALAAGGAMTLDIYTPSAGIRAFALTRTAARYGERLVHHDAILGVLARLRARVFANLTRLDPATAARFTGSALLHRLTSDIDALDQLYLRSLAPPAVALLALVALAGLIAFVDASRAGSLTLALLIAVTAVWVTTMRRSTRTSAAIVDRGQRLRAHALAALAGLAELRTYGSWTRHRQRLRALGDALVSAQSRMALRTAAAEAAITLIVHASVAAALIAGLLAYRAGQHSLALAVLPALALWGLSEILGQLPSGAVTLGRSRAIARHLNRQLTTAARVAPPANPAEPPRSHDLALTRIDYAPGLLADPVLTDCTLCVEQGETVVVSGDSGGGKSTLGDLCARLIDPDRGRVALGGADVRTLSRDTLRARVAYLRQHPHLFAETIAENLRIADPEADEADLWRALWLAGLDERVAAAPERLHTWIGSGGTGLSAGEARRLALARTLLADRPVVILDEPLAGLDPTTAAQVAERVEGALAQRTVLVLAHEEAPVPCANRRLHLRAGQLAGA
jgi:ATP-binding cassette subfamily C protein CydC